jgi:hypothetical protein
MVLLGLEDIACSQPDRLGMQCHSPPSHTNLLPSSSSASSKHRVEPTLSDEQYRSATSNQQQTTSNQQPATTYCQPETSKS